MKSEEIRDRYGRVVGVIDGDRILVHHPDAPQAVVELSLRELCRTAGFKPVTISNDGFVRHADGEALGYLH